MRLPLRLSLGLIVLLALHAAVGPAQENPPGRGLRLVEEPGAQAAKYRQTWAVIVGVDQYAEAGTTLPPLLFAVNDAREFRDLVREEFGYADDHILFLVDQAATRRSVREALEKWLPERKLEPDDAVLVFFSGHGLIEKKSNHGYLALSDSSPDGLEQSCIPVAWLRDRLAALPCRHKAVILDCCYSGSLFESEGAAPGAKGPAANLRSVPEAGAGSRTAAQPAAANLRSVPGGAGPLAPTDNLPYYLRQPAFLGLSAGRFTPVADGLGKDRHSVFTSALLKVMRERADSPRPDQVFTFRQLASLVETQVANALGSRQIPNWGRLGAGDGDFLFFSTKRRETPQTAKLRTQADAIHKEARLALEKGNPSQAMVLFAKSNAVAPNLPAQLAAQRLLAQGPKLRALVPLPGSPLPLRLSRDARRAVVGLSTGEVALVTFPDKLDLVKIDEGPVSLDWSPDEKWIAASVGRKPLLRLLTADGVKRGGQDLPLSVPAFIVQFSPDSRHLLVSTLDGSMLLFEVATGRRLAQVIDKDPKKAWPRFVAYSRDGRRILCTGGSELGVIDAYDAELAKTLGGIRRQYVPFTALPQNSDGIRVVTGAGRTAAQFDLDTGKTGAVQDQIGQVVRIHHAPDDASAWLALSDGVVKRCKWADLAVLGEPIRHVGSVNGLDFNPAMTRMACAVEAGRQGALYCWDLETMGGTGVPPVDGQTTGKMPVPPPVRRIDGGEDCIDAVLAQDGRMLATRHADGSVSIRDMR
jgi:uncharacterized caspase-like protein